MIETFEPFHTNSYGHGATDSALMGEKDTWRTPE